MVLQKTFKMKSEKLLIGHKLKKLRLDLSISQVEMANEISISPSYLNLIESNQRPLTVQLLFRLGQVYNIDLKEFSDDETGKLTAELSEIFADPILNSSNISKRDIKQIAGTSPIIASSIIDLYNAYSKARETLQVNNKEGFLNTKATPLNNIRKFLEKSNNYFTTLENCSDLIRKKLKVNNEINYSNLRFYLEDQLQIKIQIVPQSVMVDVYSRNDPHRNRILLSESLRHSERVFQVSSQIALIEFHEEINKIIKRSNLIEEKEIYLLKITLAGYFALSLMMPYNEFKDAANETRHDINILAGRFSVSFEQVCQRLTTLNKNNNKGIPFFFLKFDESGHITKRLSSSGTQFPNQCGSNPKWAPHQTFKTPGKILLQFSELDDGKKYITIARTVNQPRDQNNNLDESLFSITLVCEIRYANEIIYINGTSVTKSTHFTKIGLGCRICGMNICEHKDVYDLSRDMNFDPNIRHAGYFEFGN